MTETFKGEHSDLREYAFWLVVTMAVKQLTVRKGYLFIIPLLLLAYVCNPFDMIPMKTYVMLKAVYLFSAALCFALITSLLARETPRKIQ